MSKKIVAIIVIIALVAGAAGFALTRSGDDSAQQSTTPPAASTEPDLSEQKSRQASEAFSALATDQQSFVATITTTGSQGDSTGTLEYDKKQDAMRFTSTVDGQTSDLIYTSDAYYICQGPDSCFKTSLGQGNTSGFDSEGYEYTAEELDRFRNLAAYQGTAACPAGSCDTWKIDEGDTHSLIYIDTKTKRISKVETTLPSGSNTIEYTYKDVTITIPANAQELPSLQGIGN